VLADVGRRAQGLADTRQLRRAGVSRSRLSRAVLSGQVLRVRPAVYALAPLPPRPLHLVTENGVSPAYVAHVRAALLSLGPTAAACGRTAAALRGWALLVEPARTVEVAVPHGRSHVRAAGVRVQRRRGSAVTGWAPLADTDPLQVTPALQTALDCARTLPLLEAVVACDSALRSGQVDLDALTGAVTALPGHSGARRAASRRAVRPAQRLRARDGLPRARRAGGDRRPRFPARALRPARPARASGLLLRGRRAGGRGGRRQVAPGPARDRARDNLLAALGWRVLRFTWAEVVHEPDAVMTTVLEALSAATASTRLVADLLEDAA
jgi:hypothetical protein